MTKEQLAEICDELLREALVLGSHARHAKDTGEYMLSKDPRVHDELNEAKEELEASVHQLIVRLQEAIGD